MTKTEAFVNVRKYHFADTVNDLLRAALLVGTEPRLTMADFRHCYKVATVRAAKYMATRQSKFLDVQSERTLKDLGIFGPQFAR